MRELQHSMAFAPRTHHMKKFSMLSSASNTANVTKNLPAPETRLQDAHAQAMAECC
jgi:hypothetical protein